MDITTVGVDLAKDIVTVYAADAAGRVVQVRDLRKKDFSAWLIELPKGCVVGMEACSGAHHWARVLHGFGLTPKIMAAEFVTAFNHGFATGSANDVFSRPLAQKLTETLGQQVAVDSRPE